MSYPAILAVAALLVGGCQKKSKAAPAVHQEPSTQVVATAIDGAAASPEKNAEELANASLWSKLAADLISRDAVAFSTQDKAVIWADGYHVEGYGTTTLYRKRLSQEATTIAEIETGDERQARQEAAAAKELVTLFEKGAYLRLEKIEWEEGEEQLEVERIERVLHWKKMSLSIGRKGKPPMKLDDYKEMDPHVPIPTAVFAKAGAGVVVVEITYDPGEDYHEGFTINRQMHVFAYREQELAAIGPL